jgi:hypothetical protein
MGTAASHLARGKAAVAAYLELVPEFEKSIKKELPSGAASSSYEGYGNNGNSGNSGNNVSEIVFGEVVDDE